MGWDEPQAPQLSSSHRVRSRSAPGKQPARRARDESFGEAGNRRHVVNDGLGIRVLAKLQIGVHQVIHRMQLVVEIASFLCDALASIFAAAWKYMTKKEKAQRSKPLTRLYAFKEPLCTAGSEAELAETERRIDEIFKSELEKHARGDADATDTGALGLAMQQLANAAGQRRVALADKAAPAPQMSLVT